MMKAGFIGLGALGSAMAKRLIDEGVDLVVWNRTIGKVQGLNAAIAASPADLIRQVNLVFLNLRDSAAVEAVLTGDKGLLAETIAGKVIIDTTTNHFDAVTRFADLVRRHGGFYLEAPVAGSVIPASQGKLTVLVSGDESALEQARPYLEKIGSNIVYFGAPSLATKMKLVNNLVLGSFMATIAEAVALAEAAGLDKTRVMDALALGAGNSGVLNAKRQKLLDEDFSPHFSTSLIYKDLDYVQDLARRTEQPLFVGSTAKELYALASLHNLGDLDFSVLYRLLKGPS